MSRNIYSEPRVYIGKKEITTFTSVSFSQKGNNKASQVTVSIMDPELDDSSLIGKDLIFYLNYGANDAVPFFRGIINSYNPSDKKITVTALDVIGLLSGKSAPKIILTDDSNYDGFTVGQMLHDYITTYINITSKANGNADFNDLIGLDMLNDTNPTYSLTGIRDSKGVTPIKLVQKALSKQIADDDLNDIRSTSLVVRYDGVKSNIAFVREQSINDAGIKFSFNDGIEKINYKKRPSPNFFTSVTKKGRMEYQHNTSTNLGVFAQELKGDFEYPDKAREQAFIQATKAENEKEITLQVSKGFYLEIGNVINLQTPTHPDLTGKHRIKGKKLNISGNKIKCSLSLSKELPSVSDYLE